VAGAGKWFHRKKGDQITPCGIITFKSGSRVVLFWGPVSKKEKKNSIRRWWAIKSGCAAPLEMGPFE
jgi:hypothetical protein